MMRQILARILWLVVVIGGLMIIPLKPAFPQRSIFLDPNRTTFKPYGWATVYGALSKDTLTPGGELFAAFPVQGPFGSFASGRYENHRLRVFGGGVYAPYDGAQIGVGYGRERIFRDSVGSYGYDYWSGNNLAMAYFYTHSKKGHLRAQLEYADYDGFDYYDYYSRDYRPRERIWYDAEAMRSILGTEEAGVALGIQARRHQGIGPRFELNSQNFRVGAAGGFDFEQKFIPQTTKTYLDNRLKAAVFITLRFQ